MKRSMVFSILLFAASVGGGVFAPRSFADQADYWHGWRDRQRAELATLPKPLEPPPGEGSAIDRFLAAHWAKLGAEAPAKVPDRVFARRVYLDVVGLLPTVEQVDRFERDSQANFVDQCPELHGLHLRRGGFSFSRPYRLNAVRSQHLQRLREQHNSVLR